MALSSQLPNEGLRGESCRHVSSLVHRDDLQVLAAYAGMTGTAHRGIPPPSAQGRIKGRVYDSSKGILTPSDSRASPSFYEAVFGPDGVKTGRTRAYALILWSSGTAHT